MQQSNLINSMASLTFSARRDTPEVVWILVNQFSPEYSSERTHTHKHIN